MTLAGGLYYEPNSADNLARRCKSTLRDLIRWREAGGELVVAREAIQELSQYLKETWGTDLGGDNPVSLGLAYIDAQMYNAVEAQYDDWVNVPHFPPALAPVVAWLDEIALTAPTNAQLRAALALNEADKIIFTLIGDPAVKAQVQRLRAALAGHDKDKDEEDAVRRELDFDDDDDGEEDDE